ncbi:MAG: type II toxin-antitoxin system Phd/YefM family antitoxin [Firmicutes bacterium]|nr:type II toxin-antitoxin system Phd/YefM family antitoxin [Bacillota bacterium]MBQ4409569.1 type II toxin-antitoxin system Phd/YefM family antitoxin [Bacillota bacterium]MBR0052086.1 type II toxin-antitoxin system Phd/YefM family antitoxin [Bacillota bacterium]MBR0210596.1 type II toxin-antitoxin system Phd/YefM family antitoxin [Bacillota bacterium]MBR0517587.1 type II toxin-antitoxin system Phd/YefM family antitoxin [Bacillota bacterium]
MIIDTEKILSMTEANQNFSRAAKMADKFGEIVIFKNNKPKYVLYNVDASPQIEMSDEEKIEFVARRILKQHLAAFQELAK